MNNLNIEHIEVGQIELENIVTNQIMPVKRTPHIGNQNTSELCIQLDMPPGIDICAVDTIRGNDNYSNPRVLKIGEKTVPIAASKSSGQIVGSVTVRDDIEKFVPINVLELLNIVPGKSLMDVHQDVLRQLNPNNMPVPSMDNFSRQPDTLNAVVQALLAKEGITRQVLANGKITEAFKPSAGSLFGVDDNTPKNEGALLPLNGMLALDVLMLSRKGFDTSLHLAGPDMIKYTRDAERMRDVADIICKSMVLLGMPDQTHCLKISDMTEFRDARNSNSQHEIVLSQQINLTDHKVAV